jgi:hypothetical protein
VMGKLNKPAPTPHQRNFRVGMFSTLIVSDHGLNVNRVVLLGKFRVIHEDSCGR